MNNVDTAKDALRNLTVTELNNMVPFIKNLLSLRRRTAARQNIDTLKPGDNVIISGIRPPSMNGQIGEVMELKITKAVVRIPGTLWAKGVDIPASCLTKV